MPTSKSPFGAILWHFWGYEASSGFCASVLISGLILTCSVRLVGAVYDYGWTTFGLIFSLRRGHLCRALPWKRLSGIFRGVGKHDANASIGQAEPWIGAVAEEVFDVGGPALTSAISGI